MKQETIDPALTRFPSSIRREAFLVPKEERMALIEKKFGEILEILGLDLTDSSISKTPSRVAKMYVEEIFEGLDPNNFPAITFQEERLFLNQMLIVKDIALVSFCEHHFVPMMGRAHIAYIPKKRVIGLSKIHRIVRYFSRRPQLQERLTAQISDSLTLLLESDDVAILIDTVHTCVLARGVEDHLSKTITQQFSGAFLTNKELRSDFFRTIGLPEIEENNITAKLP